MQIPKPSDSDKAKFRSLVEDLPDAEVRAMFGNLGAFVNGNMFAGLFGGTIGVKLPATERDALLAAGGGPFGPPQRPMSGYVTLPAHFNTETMRDHLRAALQHVAAFPAKPKATNAKR